MKEPPTAGRDAMNRVKAGFILQNTTLKAWCRANGIDPSAVRQAVYGSWCGPKGRAMRDRVMQAAGVRKAA